MEIELLRCSSFQSLKSNFNTLLTPILIPSSTNKNNNNKTLPPHVLIKLRRAISEGFHRWYFDAVGTTRSNNNNNCNDDDNNHQQQDPLLLPTERLFEKSVISRIVQSLVETTAPPKSSNNSEDKLPIVENAFNRTLKDKYAALYFNFARYTSRVTTQENHTNGNNKESNSFTVELISDDENLNNKETKTTSPSTTLWLSVDFSSSSLISSSDLFASSKTVSLPIDKDRFLKLFNNFTERKSSISATPTFTFSSSSSSPFPQEFLSAVFKMILRYAALSDDNLLGNSNQEFANNNNNNNNNTTLKNTNFLKRSALSGTGQHSAVPPSVMNVLSETMGVSFECFASPLNCHCSRFCSVFRDTDECFGSFGSFFELLMATSPTSKNANTLPLDKEGISFELNPPFVEDVMEKARQKAEEILSSMKNNSNNSPVSFLIVLPHWVSPPTPCIANIRKNEGGFLRGELVLAAGEHGYLDGAQHRIGTADGGSQYKTNHESVIFALQNEAAATKWPFSDEVKEKIRQAFADAVGKIAPVGPEEQKPNHQINNNARRQRE